VNRFQREMRSLRKRWARRRSKAFVSPSPAPEVIDPRAKSQRHGKVTADRWNQ
jgi:hypothetical protein